MRYINVIIFAGVVMTSLPLIAQQNIGIGTSSPNASALLEVNSSAKGILIPRISLTGITDITTIPSPANSLLVYNNNSALPDGRGFYFWNGAANEWTKLVIPTDLNSYWSNTGNAGTNASVNFIGTTDSRALVFKTNNILSGKIDPGSNNVFFGQSAGIATKSATNNSFFGEGAGASDSSGNNNLFAGHNAGFLNRTGSLNVFLGQDAGRNSEYGSSNVFIGEDAGYQNLAGDESVFIGSGAGRNKTGARNIAIGFDALSNGYASARYNIAIGHGAGRNAGNSYNLPPGGGIYIGTGSGYNATGGIALGDSSCRDCAPLSETYNNVAIGSKALMRTSIGFKNAAVGGFSMQFNTNGEGNSAMGWASLENNTTGDYNTSLGNEAMKYNETGDYNTALGASAGPLSSAVSLVNTSCIGYNAKVSTSNTMVFGNPDVNKWLFGLISGGANHAIEVGSTNANGNGAYLTNAGVWTNISDINKKEDFSSLNEKDLLRKIGQLNVQRWKYKGTSEYHIGPVAQQFYELFNVGTDDKAISTIDPAGISLIAIQALVKENEALRNRIEKLEAMILKKE